MGWGSDAFASFSWAVDMLLSIVEDVKIPLAGGSVSYWIKAADGVPLTVVFCPPHTIGSADSLTP
jgi:hypothetical protein